MNNKNKQPIEGPGGAADASVRRTPEPHQAEPTDRWEQALSRARLGVWDVDLVGGHCVYSKTWKHMLGYEDRELSDDDELWLTFVHPDDRDRAITAGDRHLAGETDDIEAEFRMRHKDGHWVWIIDRGGIVERDARGTPTRMLGVQADISRQKKAEHDLEKTNERLRLALDASGVGIWEYDPDANQLVWDERMFDIYGVDPAVPLKPTQSWQERLHPDDREEVEALTSASLGVEGVNQLQYRIVRPDGEVRHVESLTKYVPNADAADRFVGVIRDITEEVEGAEALATEKERLRVTLQSISDAVISTGTDGRIDFANAAAGRLTRCPDNGLLGLTIDEALDCDRVLAGQKAKTAPMNADGLLKLTDRDGALHLVRCAISPIAGPNGATAGAVYVLQDVTEEQARQQELARAARYDPLTGLLNRCAFEEELHIRVKCAANAPFALFYIDLDHFKTLNDFAGHAAGDAALQEVARCLVQTLPDGAHAARLGGDEFAVILPACDAAGAERVAAAVLDAIRTAEYDDYISDRRLGASIGIRLVEDDTIPPTDVLALADDACYAAKNAGRNRHVVSRAETHKGLTAVRLVADVADALEDGRLKLYGQEIRSLDQPWQRGSRLEVLARLVDRHGKSVPPCEFIPAAERFNMAAMLDRWIFRQALHRFGAVMHGPGGLLFGFNMSAQTLSDQSLWDFVSQTIAECGVTPSNIVFEITETAAVTNFEAAEAFIHSARATGCRVSLDDFGAGLSSFGYLRRFPVDSVKIDGNFVSNIATNGFDRAIVGSIHGLARDLGFQTVAERIEDEASIPVLQELGVTYGQGFLLHKPEPLEDLVQALTPGHCAGRSKTTPVYMG